MMSEKRTVKTTPGGIPAKPGNPPSSEAGPKDSGGAQPSCRLTRSRSGSAVAAASGAVRRQMKLPFVRTGIPDTVSESSGKSPDPIASPVPQPVSVVAWTDRIVKLCREVDDHRKKCGNIKGPVSGDMKTGILNIIKAAEEVAVLSRLRESSGHDDLVRDLRMENEALRAELSNLREVRHCLTPGAEASNVMSRLSLEEVSLGAPPQKKAKSNTVDAQPRTVWADGSAMIPGQQANGHLLPVDRGSRAKPNREGARSRVPDAPAKKKTSLKGPKQRQAKPTRVARPPKTVALAVKGKPEILRDAMDILRKEVDWRSFGIGSIHVRQSASGGRIIEIPRSNGGDEKAKALATRMREVLPEGVKVERPSGTLAVRLSGFDDSVSEHLIREELGCRLSCPSSEIKVGSFSLSGRVGSVVVRLRPEAATALANLRKVQLGWTMVKCRLLDPRPLQCHQCLGYGHVRANCTGQDRSSKCWNCGGDGHTAAACNKVACCMLCEGNPPHKTGGKGCPARKGARRPKTKTPGGGDNRIAK